MIRQNTKLIGLYAIALLWLLAAHAVCVAQCQGGNCRVQWKVNRPILSKPAAVVKGTFQAPKAVLGRTRLFDGDGRPLRKAGR